MDGEKKCSWCGKIKPFSEFYPNKARKNGLQSQCKVCDKAKSTENRRAKRLGYHVPKNELMISNKTWKKTNKNHYPDSEWVWAQLEMGITGERLYDRMDQKYELKAHGNLGKSHKKHTNPWIKRRANQ